MNQQKISIQTNNPKRGSVTTSVEEAKKTVIEFIDEDTVSITVVKKDSESKPKRAFKKGGTMKRIIYNFLDWCEFYLPMCLVGAGVGAVIGAVISIIYKVFLAHN